MELEPTGVDRIVDGIIRINRTYYGEDVQVLEENGKRPQEDSECTDITQDTDNLTHIRD